MELALYCPDSGYYEQRKNRIGRTGDYYTSVGVGTLFGRILASKFAEWLESHPLGTVQIVEGGAHDGSLASDILSWLKLHRPGLFSRLEYWLIEPSTERQSWQREALVKFAGTTRWALGWHDLAQSGVAGIIFSNELLDAFPIHRMAWDAEARVWFEWGVGSSGDDFVWKRRDEIIWDWRTESEQSGFLLSPEIESVLPDGFVVELCPAATRWWRKAAETLRQGRLMTIDYGFTAEEFLQPERVHGTLRAYSKHRNISSVLAEPGDQDLTAHVNFTALQNAGETVGLRTDALVSQAQFLSQRVDSFWNEMQFGHVREKETFRQFQTLVHPSHLGHSFRVLLQSCQAGKVG